MVQKNPKGTVQPSPTTIRIAGPEPPAFTKHAFCLKLDDRSSSVGLGQKLRNADYRVLLKWWLGLPLRYVAAAACPRCNEACDPFGDHFVSCKLNKPVRRHNALRNALADVLLGVGIPCTKEVPIGGRVLADLGLLNFDARGPLAVDLVCTHPAALSPSRTGETTKCVAAAEKRKSSNQSRFAILMDGSSPLWDGILGVVWVHTRLHSYRRWRTPSLGTCKGGRGALRSCNSGPS